MQIMHKDQYDMVMQGNLKKAGERLVTSVLFVQRSILFAAQWECPGHGQQQRHQEVITSQEVKIAAFCPVEERCPDMSWYVLTSHIFSSILVLNIWPDVASKEITTIYRSTRVAVALTIFRCFCENQWHLAPDSSPCGGSLRPHPSKMMATGALDGQMVGVESWTAMTYPPSSW